VVTVLDTQSSYQYEINAPQDRPLRRHYTFKTTMAGTTMDLQSGTTKHTYHLPGFGGSIPHSLRHNTLRMHAEGREPRPAVRVRGVSGGGEGGQDHSCNICSR
jgi:hypothetical protein